MFILESFGIEFSLMAYDELRCYMISCFAMISFMILKLIVLFDVVVYNCRVG